MRALAGLLCEPTSTIARSPHLGLTAYRQAFDDRLARQGRQPNTLAGAELWVLPNPSGLNAHETALSLAAAYRQAALAAGVAVSEPAVGGQ